MYQWIYRPEMQYSVLELETSSINRTEEGSELSQELLEERQPTIEATNELLEITSALISEEYDPLTFFGPEGDWLYSLAEYEALVAPVQEGEGSTTSIDSLWHIGNLDSSDFLSLNLIDSTDRGNVLWEFVFGSCYLVSNETLVSADEPVVQLTLICKCGKSDVGSEVTVAWRVLGSGGELEQTSTTSLNEVFTNLLTTSHSSGDVIVRLDAIDGTPVIWNTTRGQLIDAESTIENGQAVATLGAGKIAGDAMISVAVAGSTHAVFVEHTTPIGSELSVTPDSPVIVGKQSDSGVGTVEIKSYDDSINTYTYPTRTSLNIKSGDVGVESRATKLILGTPNQPNAMFSRSFGFSHIIDEGTANAHTMTEILSDEQSTPARLQVIGAVSVDATLSTTLPGTSLGSRVDTCRAPPCWRAMSWQAYRQACRI